jgi:glyoxylase-like metal-dependent hydrolase (beta-lactamase superfamily II)
MTTTNFLVTTKIQLKGVCIHCCTSPDDGERVNAQIVETANKLVIVDAMLMRAHAKEFRAYADALGKPIDRIFITHAHPDHWFGIEFFEDVRSCALPQTIQEIQMMGQLEIDFHRNQHGDLTNDQIRLPKEAVEEGQLEIDGVIFGLHKVEAAEDLFMLVIDLPNEKTLLAQDLIYNKVHMFVGQRSMDGTTCFAGWTAALEKFKKGGYSVVIPGHGVPTDGTVFDANISQLAVMQEIYATSDGSNFVQRAVGAFPNYGLASMLEMSNYFLFIAKF